MKKYIIIGLLIAGMLPFNSSAQQVQKKMSLEALIGKPFPDFGYKKIDYYSKERVSLKDFKGKWLMLDLWSKGCSGCIAGMPHVNELQEQFAGQLQFVLVGEEDKENQIRPLYAKLRKNEKLNLPIIFDSSFIHSYEDIHGYPACVIIDPNGIIRAVSQSGLLNPGNTAELVAGKFPVLRSYFANDAGSPSHSSYTQYIPFLTNGIRANGGNDTGFLFRSLLAQWNTTMPVRVGPNQFITDVRRTAMGSTSGRLEIIDLLAELYGWAYFGRELRNIGIYDSLGKVYPLPVLETKDSFLLSTSSTALIKAVNTGKGLYCYSLTVPPSKWTKEFLMKIMQQDLMNYFGYDVRIESREMPCLKLVATIEARLKLKTKGEKRTGKYLGSTSSEGFTATNIPLTMIRDDLYHFGSSAIHDIPIINETGIEGNIDITMDCVWSDIDSVKRALQSNGLDLVPGKREMRCLVIRDPKN